VLSFTRDNMIALTPMPSTKSEQGQIGRLRGTRSKGYFRSSAIDQFCHLPTCSFHSIIGIPAKRMVATGIAEIFSEIGQHRLDHT